MLREIKVKTLCKDFRICKKLNIMRQRCIETPARVSQQPGQSQITASFESEMEMAWVREYIPVQTGNEVKNLVLVFSGWVIAEHHQARRCVVES